MRPITILLSALIGPFLTAQNCVYTFGDDPAHPLNPNGSELFPKAGTSVPRSISRSCGTTFVFLNTYSRTSPR